jgi:hypothetical protein
LSEWILGDECAEAYPLRPAEPPWTNQQGALRYLGTATSSEMRVLAETAAIMLDCGDWWGVHSKRGWYLGLSTSVAAGGTELRRTSRSGSVQEGKSSLKR